MKKYLATFSTWIKNHTMYRARMLVWFSNDVVSFIAFPFIWLSVYAHRDLIAGFNQADIVTYYIIIGYISTIASAHQSRAVRLDITTGTLNGHITKPLNYFFISPIRDIAFHFITFFMGTFVVSIVFLLFPEYVVLPNSIWTWGLFYLSITFSYIISLCFEQIMGLSSFWFGEITGITQIYSLTTAVLSGELAPLVFFPLFIQNINKFLPFQYLFNFPAEIYLGKLTSSQIAATFLQELVWIAGLIAFCVFLWRRGLKRYDGSGI